MGDEEDGHDHCTLGRPGTVAPMTGHRLLPGTDPRLRVGPWRGDGTVAHLAPGRGRPTLATVHRAVEDLAANGYRTAITGALSAPDQLPFRQAGFEVHERLHLLVRNLDRLPDTAPADLRRGHPSDRARVLEVDAAAFPAFWRLDGPGLTDALAATPSARFRVATDPAQGRRVIGYAVTGRAGPRGYLQRLAVEPGHQRTGIGGALVVDGLRWLRRWGAKEVLVNTQEGNEPAVRLYESLGFGLRPEGLAVLRLTLGDAP
jgi:ribosomal protein S18 acetylase RimI-like enzyme